MLITIPSPPTSLILTLLIILPIISLILLNRVTRRKMGATRVPPGPRRLPIIGNLHQLGKLPHRSLWTLSREYGPAMLLLLGDVPALVVSSAETAREVLKTHDIDTCSRPASPGPGRLSYNYLDIAFSPYTEYWREIRKLFTVELLSAKRVQSIWLVREKEVESLVCFLRGESGNVVNMNERVFAMVDGIVGTVAFGKMYGREKFKDRNFQSVLDEAMNMLASLSAEDFFPRWGRTVERLTGQRGKLEKSFNDLYSYYQYVIDKHRRPSWAANKEDSADLVDVLLNLQKDPKNKLTLTDDHIKAILMDAFIGGIDTSSITILWAMSELMRNPRVLNRAQEEIRSHVSKKPRVGPDDLGNLPYLKMVARETLRLHPPATLLLPRETPRPCEIGGYDIPARTRIFVNVWGIGRDPRYWENPEEFNPDRSEGTDVDFKGQNFELLPFGGGRRICPGLSMGAATVEFALANLLYCFDWKLPEGTKTEDFSMEEEGGLTTHRKMPLCLVPINYNV